MSLYCQKPFKIPIENATKIVLSSSCHAGLEYCDRGQFPGRL